MLFVEVTLGRELDQLLQVGTKRSLHKEQRLNVAIVLALRHYDIEKLWREEVILLLLKFVEMLHNLDLAN